MLGRLRGLSERTRKRCALASWRRDARFVVASDCAAPNWVTKNQVDEEKLERLSERQKDCLRLVAAHLTSKQIARELGVSRFTIDQRLDAARRTLGVSSRKEAALLFAKFEHSDGMISERFVYEPPPLASRPFSAPFLNEEGSTGSAGGFDHHPNANPVQRQKQTLLSRLSNRLVRLSFPPLGGVRHDLARSNIALMSLKIAFHSTVLLAATIAIIIGTMRLFQG
jgi:DNA-binding CsgD family transcriptional regulator